MFTHFLLSVCSRSAAAQFGNVYELTPAGEPNNLLTTAVSGNLVSGTVIHPVNTDNVFFLDGCTVKLVSTQHASSLPVSAPACMRALSRSAHSRALTVDGRTCCSQWDGLSQSTIAGSTAGDHDDVGVSGACVRGTCLGRAFFLCCARRACIRRFRP